MTVSKFIGHLTIIFLICLLMVLAESVDTRPQSRTQQTHHTHHQQQYHNHHNRQHLTKLRHHLNNSSSSGSTSSIIARQSQKLSPLPYLTRSPSHQTLREQKHPDSQVELIDDVKSIPKNITSTKLRRLSARDYYNKAVQRRYNGRRSGRDDWAYNTYNIHTNTYGSPQTDHAGKGDDNSDDVEFVSNTGVKSQPDWSRRGYGGSLPTLAPTTTTRKTTMAPPPALVPARRGYPLATSSPPLADSPTTDDPFETNTISSRNPSGTDPKDMEKRHICVQQRTVTMPVKSTEIYTRPIWKHVSTPCQPQTHVNQMCTRVQLVHEQAFRDVIRHKSAQQVTYDCCAGWMRESPHADGCMKPICAARCQNGGSCSGPDSCTCPTGFTGRYCEHDINECKEEKPCDQTCINTVGSYYCKCRDGFTLQADQQSCRKIDLHQDDAFEARDLENEIETQEDITARLQKIEKQLANERVQSNELQKTLHSTYTMVDSLKSRLVNLEKQQLDYNRLQTNLYNTESRTMKLEGMVNLLLKCRNGPNAHCP